MMPSMVLKKTHHDELQSALSQEMISRGLNYYPGRDLKVPPKQRSASILTQSKSRSNSALERVAPIANDDPRYTIYFEREVILDDINQCLAKKLRNMSSRSRVALSTSEDFALVISDALANIPAANNNTSDAATTQKKSESTLSFFDEPFGLHQMQALRENIMQRIDNNIAAGDALCVLVKAIDRVMEQHWNVRPLGVRTQANEGHAK